MRLILPSITTLGTTTSGWRDKIAEIEPLGLRTVGLFLTGLGADERDACYQSLGALRKHYYFRIPFVHATASMHEAEYKLLISEFGTEVFNLHPTKEYPLEHDLSSGIRERIYIENSNSFAVLTSQDLEGFAGVCLDVAHLEETRLNDIDDYRKMQNLLSNVKIGANHISAIWYKTTIIGKGRRRFAQHVLRTGRDMLYLRGYPEGYFSDYCALELENSLAEQARLVHVITQLLSSKNTSPSLKDAA